MDEQIQVLKSNMHSLLRARTAELAAARAAEVASYC